MITTLILTKNHESIISSTLESVKSLGPILIANLGNDKTQSICENIGATVYNIPFNYDYSSIRNTLANKANTEWLFWLDPGEILTSGQEFFEADKPDKMYRAMVLKGDILLKEPRLFRKGHKFSKPVFESLDDIAEQTLPIVITGNTELDYQSMMDCLVRWRDKEPLLPDIDYYLACLHLMCKRYNQFLNIADKFLFQNKTSEASVVLTKYYVASLLKKSNTGKALQLILECIAEYPLMAEFWCLLGDLYLFFIKEYDRAYHFYDNAMLLGSQRLAEDTMPMEISKYEEYPQKVMNVIRQAIFKAVNK